MRSLKEMMSLQGRTALITGGAGHIAYAAAESLAEMGANLILLDREKDSLNKVASKISDEYSVRVIGIEFNLEDIDNFSDVVAEIECKTGSLDILIHMAAFVGTSGLDGWVVPFSEQTIDTWKRALDVNLSAVFELTKLCTPLLKKSNAASVITVGSLYGVLGPDMSLYEGTEMGNPAAYAASKGGVVQLTRWLSTVLAPNVRINAITPGGVWRNQDKKFIERFCSRTPLGRMSTEEDLKGVIMYLASDLSSYVTGQNILIDGGWSVW